MATRQQLRGDGSKEYQIITNLSRGINNAVADDVLVDNAFRDVVNFSSDQLGNISKRDNLLNSNFKEFIRKLAYGDFNLDTFSIDRSNTKMFSYGRKQQLQLQSLYENMFTENDYWTDTVYSHNEGVAPTTDNDFFKVNTAHFTGEDYMFNQQDDLEIKQEITKLNDVVEHNYYDSSSNENVLYYTDKQTGKKVYIDENSIPENWILSEDKTTIRKQQEQVVNGDSTSVYKGLPIGNDGKFLNSEDVSLTLITTFGNVTKKTSIVAQNKIKHRLGYSGYNFEITREENDDYVKISIIAHNPRQYIVEPYQDCYGVQGDEGWQPEIHKGLDTTNNKDVVGITKTFYKNDINYNTAKSLRFVFGNYYDDYCFSIYNIQSMSTGYTSRYHMFTGNTHINNLQLKDMQVLKQSEFFKQIQNLDSIFKEGSYNENKELDNDIYFSAYLIFYGNVEVYTNVYIDKTNYVTQLPDNKLHIYKYKSDLIPTQY